jgi:hypothetical protein
MTKLNSEELQTIKNLIYFGDYEGIIFPNGLIYLGGLYQNIPHGNGSIILPNGNTYDYEFCNGKLADGRSIIFYPDGSFYEGEVSSINNPYGKGIIRNLDGSIYYQGNWDNDYDPKIVWRCDHRIVWYKNGEVFQMNSNGGYPSAWDYILYPAVCLEMPSSNLNQAFVMFPHLQDLGCPNSKNYGCSIFSWSNTPEEAVKYAGFKNLQDYFEWIYKPDLKILKRMLETVETTEFCLKLFGLFPQKHEHDRAHNIVHKLTDKTLEVVKSLLEQKIKEIENY